MLKLNKKISSVFIKSQLNRGISIATKINLQGYSAQIRTTSITWEPSSHSISVNSSLTKHQEQFKVSEIVLNTQVSKSHQVQAISM